MEYGDNTAIAHIHYIRHAEKGVSTSTAETGLSENGREQSISFGRALEERAAIRAYASDTDRTRGTGQLILDASPTKRKMGMQVVPELAFHYDRGGAFLKTAMAIKRETLGDGFGRLPPDEQARRVALSDARQIDYYLRQGISRPDPDTLSPLETAALICRLLNKQIEGAKEWAAGLEVDIINISHDFVIAATVQALTGHSTLKEMGGTVAYLEGFEVLIVTGQAPVLIFRGQKYPIALLEMEGLVQIGEALDGI